MALAKYQPVQDDAGATSPRALYAGDAVGSGQSRPDFFPFIVPSSQPTESTTETVGRDNGSSLEAQQPAALRPIVAVPRFGNPDYHLQLLQQWECVVRAVTGDEMVAVLYDLTDRTKPEEEATFPLEEVSPSDRDFVEPGAVFYWSIGYRTSSTGQKDRVSQIRFRRLPSWTRGERRAAEREALEFEELLGQ